MARADALGRVLPVFRWKHWFSVASPRMWIHTACMAQSAETEQIMKEEDMRHVICTQFSTDSPTLRCHCLQAVRWGAKNMNLEISRPVFTTSLFLISCGTQSKWTTIFEPQILHVWNGDKKNPCFGICGEYYIEGKSQVLSSVPNTWQAFKQRQRGSVVGSWGRVHGCGIMCTLVLSSRAHTGTSKHLVNECRPPTLRKACDELFHDSEKLPFALVGEYVPKNSRIKTQWSRITEISARGPRRLEGQSQLLLKCWALKIIYDSSKPRLREDQDTTDVLEGASSGRLDLKELGSWKLMS